MNKTLKLLFLVSLIVNVLLVGVLMGQLPRRLERGSFREQRMEQALKDLPQPTQTRLREKFKQIRAVGDPLRDQLRAAREETLGILSADPFDEAAYDRQVSKIDDMQLQLFKKLGQVVKEVAKELSSEERRIFAQILRRPPPPPG
ncbi:MAG TPA: periplasmic heavy metal sensor [Candidatus Binatia bacterium]|nr:periplasmic heavy metal sensor [Candidatus Binatia bacterium]